MIELALVEGEMAPHSLYVLISAIQECYLIWWKETLQFDLEQETLNDIQGYTR